MCKFVYIVADRDLKTFESCKLYPGLSIERFSGKLCMDVHLDKTTSHIYLARSWEGCGCGFYYERKSELDAVLMEIPDKKVVKSAIESWNDGKKSVTSLSRFLANAVQTSRIQVYVVWAGDENLPPLTKSLVSSTYFGGDSFALKERHLYRVEQ